MLGGVVVLDCRLQVIDNVHVLLLRWLSGSLSGSKPNKGAKRFTLTVALKGP